MPRTFSPLHAPLIGSTRVPPDKSQSHRAILLAAAATGTTTINDLLDSLDVLCTLECVAQLGAHVQKISEDAGRISVAITGWGKEGPLCPRMPLNCGNSATTARLIMGLLAAYDVEAELTGDSSLSKRPMNRVTRPLASMGARFTPEEGSTLPLKLQGTSDLRSLMYRLPCASAQVKTAILLAGLRAHGTTTIIEPTLSRDHTERMLPAFGVELEGGGDGSIAVTGPCDLTSTVVCIPGDASSAAFLICAAACLAGSTVQIKDMSVNETRIGFLRVLERMGISIQIDQLRYNGHEPVGDVTASSLASEGELRAVEVCAEEIPSMIDEIPVLALVCTKARGTSVFKGVGELRIKESDRLEATVEMLLSLGCHASIEGDDLYVDGGVAKQDASIASRHDHRIAMLGAMAGWCFDVCVTIDDFDCCRVSYPQFEADIMRLHKGFRM